MPCHFEIIIEMAQRTHLMPLQKKDVVLIHIPFKEIEIAWPLIKISF